MRGKRELRAVPIPLLPRACPEGPRERTGALPLRWVPGTRPGKEAFNGRSPGTEIGEAGDQDRENRAAMSPCKGRVRDPPFSIPEMMRRRKEIPACAGMTREG